jgi:recombination protein RecR
MDGIGPDQLTIRELIARLTDGDVKEILIATNPNIEGETTAVYISKLMKPLGVRVSRLAYGVPVGGDIDYADEVTLFRAIEGRRDL